MPTKIYEFHWKALNRFQQKQSGKCLAESREKLEKQLLDKGYHNIRINRNFVLPQTPKAETITQLIQQLALLLQAAIPLKQSLTMLLENFQNIRLYQWLSQLIQQLESGYAFSTALENSAKMLSEQEIQLIKMAEMSGNLATILNNIAQSRAKSEKLSKKVKKILFYPVIVLFISISLSLLLLIFIVPQFAELYQSKEKSLPLITEILFILSHFIQEHISSLFIFGLISLSIFILLAKKTSIISHFKSTTLNHLPIFKGIMQYTRIIFFSQNCALMLNATLRLDSILLSFLSQNNQDLILQRELQHCLTLLKQGYPFSAGLNPMVFGGEVLQMISIGEKSGNLPQMLEHISDIYQQKLDYQIDLLSQLLEPMLMLIMGMIVGTIIVGLYLPIFDMGAMVE